MGAFALENGDAVSWAWDNTLRVWNIQEGTCRAVLEGHCSTPETRANYVEGGIRLPNGEVASWADDHTVRIWDVANGVCRAVLQHKGVRGALVLHSHIA